ncbi:hypothetical protein [Baekduia sp. Peel2402]|uniref:hypothetical protein n=1 Tax=Baekduia sp. Peel2402 TaxID=3458296 RepID=UPI00403ED1CC
MIRWPKSKLGKLTLFLGGLVAVGVILPLAFIGAMTMAVSYAFPAMDDESGTMPAPVTAATLFEDLGSAAAGDERRAGVRYRCVRLATGDGKRRRYRCVVPGHGAGDLVYRVSVSETDSCWRARGDAPPLDGCVTQPADLGGLD